VHWLGPIDCSGSNILEIKKMKMKEENIKIVLWHSHDLKMGNGYCWYDSTESFTYESGYVSRGALYVTKELPKAYKLADTYFDHSK
jgi:hypothetical protein